MKQPRRMRLAWLAALIALPLALPVGGCRPSTVGERLEVQRQRLPSPISRDLAAIKEDGVLRVLFTYNSTGFFIYRGETMGFEFRTIRRFAKAHGLQMRSIIVRDRDELFQKLNEGEGDIVAASLLRTIADSADVSFTSGLYRTRATLVQRTAPPSEVQLPEVAEQSLSLGDAAREGRPVQLSAKLVTRPSQLVGQKVHLPKGSPYYERLVELSNLYDGEIQVVEVEGESSSEALIREVSQGNIMFTVAPENLAQLQEEYFTNITVMPSIGPPEEVVWAVRRNSNDLLAALDAWLGENPEQVLDEYGVYFEDRKMFRERVASDYLTSETGRLSTYDELIRRHAATIDWDWRLLASQTFQESRFNPTARSWAGAVGLLQLMPRTAVEVGVRNRANPEENVRGAVKYLSMQERRWQKIEDPDERIKFVLASFNAGAGHVEDARRLAQKYGDDPDSWDDVAYWMMKKSERKYYQDPVVRYGFVRGLEPVTYVSLILERYENYVQFIDVEAPDTG